MIAAVLRALGSFILVDMTSISIALSMLCFYRMWIIMSLPVIPAPRLGSHRAVVSVWERGMERVSGNDVGVTCTGLKIM